MNYQTTSCSDAANHTLTLAHTRRRFTLHAPCLTFAPHIDSVVVVVPPPPLFVAPSILASWDAQC